MKKGKGKKPKEKSAYQRGANQKSGPKPGQAPGQHDMRLDRDKRGALICSLHLTPPPIHQMTTSDAKEPLSAPRVVTSRQNKEPMPIPQRSQQTTTSRPDQPATPTRPPTRRRPTPVFCPVRSLGPCLPLSGLNPTWISLLCSALRARAKVSFPRSMIRNLRSHPTTTLITVRWQKKAHPAIRQSQQSHRRKARPFIQRNCKQQDKRRPTKSRAIVSCASPALVHWSIKHLSIPNHQPPAEPKNKAPNYFFPFPGLYFSFQILQHKINDRPTALGPK
ncbi:hypothetical protein B0T25DRAFT_29348 [Lasiosphaeria hispida]|uniref:Uncharacterized protein n=1 Tax=Lasiosphaeria hispida TaxID=260671 RepID=A0AAJ0HUC7_9PEZI|nr:hypothetical protein B0T25DRAFT_29348 [Lasiosphaeria hispida]